MSWRLVAGIDAESGCAGAVLVAPVCVCCACVGGEVVAAFAVAGGVEMPFGSASGAGEAMIEDTDVNIEA